MLKKKNNKNDCYRIVLTGGPGGGKTTAADLFRREVGEKVVIVPETATLLYLGGFPRSTDIDARKSAQLAIYQVQKGLEDTTAAQYPDRILLCDRGSIDGAAYWPGGHGDFFKALGTTIEREMQRYHAILFFETAAVGGISIEGGNRTRTETLDQALELNHNLKRIWSKHPNFHFVAHEKSFFKKMANGLHKLETILDELTDGKFTNDKIVPAFS
jgi:predicted ATPase